MFELTKLKLLTLHSVHFIPYSRLHFSYFPLSKFVDYLTHEFATQL